MRLNNLKLILISLLILSLGGIFLFKARYSVKRQTNPTISPAPSQADQKKEVDKPQIIATKPDPLNETIIPASQVIEIVFNRPLENVGEFKVRIEPKIEYKTELSQDRKTGKIMPTKPYELGISYTLTIGPDSKFDGVGAWGQSIDYHFRTIPYKGV